MIIIFGNYKKGETMALKMFDVIRYEGENTRNILAWRHPKTDIKSGSTLIVNLDNVQYYFQWERIS